MPLAPGDRGILSVAPWVGGDRGSVWTCARCGQTLLTHDSWRIDYRHASGEYYVFIVCGRCAQDLQPVRLVIDLSALGSRGRSHGLDDVVSLAEAVVERRSGATSSALSLRWADVFELASASGETPQQLADRLAAAGVLVGEAQRGRQDDRSLRRLADEAAEPGDPAS